jgi:hypothetical protein
MTLNHKIPSHLRALYMHNTGPQPLQVEPIPTQADTVPKVSPIRREVRRVFQEEEDEAWAACIRGYTMQGSLFALLQAKNETVTWMSYM